MSREQEKRWSAYLDGELSASEATDFEESLTDRSRSRLEAEIRLERGLADLLGAEIECPDAIWIQTRHLVTAQAKKAGKRSGWWRQIVAVAAGLALVAGTLWAYQEYWSTPSFLKSARTVRDLRASVELGPHWDDAEAYLQEHGIHLALKPLKTRGLDLRHRLEFLGATHVDYRGDEVVELLFDCCRRPVTLAVAPKGSRAAALMTAAVGGDVQGMQVIGDYVVAVVGKHPTNNLMSVFTLAT